MAEVASEIEQMRGLLVEKAMRLAREDGRELIEGDLDGVEFTLEGIEQGAYPECAKMLREEIARNKASLVHVKVVSGPDRK